MSKREDLITGENEHADLIEQRTRIKEKVDASCTESEFLGAELIEAEKAHAQCEKLHIREKVSDKELATSRTKIDSLREKLSASNRLHELSKEALNDINAEILSASQTVQCCRRDLCLEMQCNISKALNDDAKTRAKLLDAYAAKISGGMGFNSDWGLFLMDVFSRPDQAEINTAVEKFHEAHQLDRL